MPALHGLTWSHSRGLLPLVAASEAWHDLDPDLSVHWDKRSLWGFGEGPLEEVARSYDLIVFDHPFTGRAAAGNLFLKLDEQVPTESIAELAADSAGPSHASYSFDGHQYGFAIDAACQTSACRPDLLSQAGESVPSTWSETIDLARRTGRVRCAFTPMAVAGLFHSLCASRDNLPGAGTMYVSREIGELALNDVRDLFEVTGRQGLDSSPVRILSSMATEDEAWYAPMVYCYSNYCRPGYAPKQLKFAPPPLAGGKGAVLGGAGIAVSSFSKHPIEAVRFARFVASPTVQSSIYLLAGGQPAARSAWQSPLAGQIAGTFFEDLLPVLDRAFVRQTYDGFTDFQTLLGALIHEFLKQEASGATTLARIDDAFHRSRKKPSS